MRILAVTICAVAGLLAQSAAQNKKPADEPSPHTSYRSTREFHKSAALARLAIANYYDHLSDLEEQQKTYREEANRALVVADSDALTKADKTILTALYDYQIAVTKMALALSEKKGRAADCDEKLQSALAGTEYRGSTICGENAPFGSGVLAQNTQSDTERTTKNYREPSTSETESKPAGEISKDFMAQGRRAFNALDNLYTHFWANLDDDTAWTPREVAAEQGRYELESVTSTPTEEHILTEVKFVVVVVLSYRSQLKRRQRIPALATPNKYKEAVDDVDAALKRTFNSPCYAADKEAVATGVLKDAGEECRPAKP